MGHAVALLNTYKFGDPNLHWVWAHMRHVYSETGEVPNVPLIRAAIESLPEETQPPLLEMVISILRTPAEDRPRAAIRSLSQRGVKLAAIDAIERASTHFGRGDDAAGLSALERTLASTAIRPGYTVKSLVPPKFKVLRDSDRIPTGLYTLDQIIGGLSEGELGLIFGDTGVGKSAIGIEIGHTAVMWQKRILHIDTENGERVTMSRYISRFTGIPQRLIENNSMGPDTRIRLDTWLARNHERLAQYLRVLYLDFASSTLGDVEAAIRSSISAGFHPDEIVFDSPDHLALGGPGGGGGRNEARWELFADLYNKLKGMTGRHKTAMWAMTQAGDSEGKLATNKSVADSKQKPRNAAIAFSVNPMVDPKTKRVIEDTAERCIYLSKNRNGPGKVILPLQVHMTYMMAKAAPNEWLRPPEETEDGEESKEGAA